MIAHRIELETQPVHGLDGALIVKQGRDEGARANQVASRHHHVVRVLALQVGYVAGEYIHATGGYGGCAGSSAEIARGLEVAMKVIQSNDLDSDGG